MDGGDDDQRDERTTLPKKYVGSTTCLLFLVFKKISLLSPTCWLWRRDNDEVDGGSKGREDNITEERMLAILPVCCCCFFGCYLFCLPHAGYGREIMTEDGGGNDRTRGQH